MTNETRLGFIYVLEAPVDVTVSWKGEDGNPQSSKEFALVKIGMAGGMVGVTAVAARDAAIVDTSNSDES